MLGSKICIHLHISILGGLGHYFLLRFEHNDALENDCIGLLHTVFLFTFLEGQVHQLECNVAFSNHYIAFHLMHLHFEIFNQKHCMEKSSLN